MSLTVSDLSCDRAGRRILHGVDFTLADGETLALRGPNGSGKSTLLRVLAGLLPAVSGKIAIDGEATPADRDAYSEKIAYAGHLDAIKPQLTVRENLRFWANLLGGNDVDAAVRAFDLHGFVERPAHACSAGQKKRLGLARLALVPRRVWLLDEPTVSLDAHAIALLMQAVAAHCGTGGVAVIATHVDLALTPLRTRDLTPPKVSHAADPFLAGAMT